MEVVALGKGAAAIADTSAWVPVCKPEDLPKGKLAAASCGVRRPALCQRSQSVCGAPADVHHPSPPAITAGVRKELAVDGRDILMFWYRNQIYAIEARSPAEGAYSEGFIRAKFTQVKSLAEYGKHPAYCAAAYELNG